jgi:hypothetical protein
LIAFILIALPSILYGQAQIFLGMIGAMAGSVGAEAAQESDFSRTGVVFATLLKKQFLYADWHLLWALFILTLVFCFKRVYKVPLVFLLALVLLDQAALFMNFSFTGAFQWVLDGTLLDRLAMNSAPVVLYFCAEALVPCLSLYTKKHRKVIQIKI